MAVLVHFLEDARPLCGALHQLLGTLRPRDVSCAACRDLLAIRKDSRTARDARLRGQGDGLRLPGHGLEPAR